MPVADCRTAVYLCQRIKKALDETSITRKCSFLLQRQRKYLTGDDSGSENVVILVSEVDIPEHNSCQNVSIWAEELAHRKPPRRGSADH